MKRLTVVLGLLISYTCHADTSNVEWFEENTPLTQAHEHLLTNQLSKMFDSLVEVWQSSESYKLSKHLNELLLQSLDVDCGKSLVSMPFPEWIKSLMIRRVEIQSTGGRDAFQVLINLVTTSQIDDISLTKWIDHSISLDASFLKLNSDTVTKKEQSYVKRYNLDNRLDEGLYRLIITGKGNKSWSTWVILEQPKLYYTIYWTSKDHWGVEQRAILNPHCPLPKMGISVYDFKKEQYSEVWGKTYESEYPTQLPIKTLTPKRYVLAVSMNHQRWQGPITIEESKVISKTYDVTHQEESKAKESN
jgi:hypothetical protein